MSLPETRPASRQLRVAAGVTWRHRAGVTRGGTATGTRGSTEILITQRPPGGPLGLMWEFPGGKLEPGESAEEALVRELHEELGVAATAVRRLATEHFVYPHGLDVEVTFVECTLASHEFVASHAVHAARWVQPEAICPQDVLEADRPFLARLAAGEFRPAADSR